MKGDRLEDITDGELMELFGRGNEDTGLAVPVTTRLAWLGRIRIGDGMRVKVCECGVMYADKSACPVCGSSNTSIEYENTIIFPRGY